MKVAGIEMPASAVAELALLLHRAGESSLAQHVGRAVDNNRAEIGLHAGERETILRILDDPPVALKELHASLLQEHATWRRRSTPEIERRAKG